MLMVSILCSVADAVRPGNWFTVFKILTFNVAMLKMFLPLSYFRLDLAI